MRRRRAVEKKLDNMHREIGKSLTKGLLTGMKDSQNRSSGDRFALLEEERAVLLTGHNYPFDYRCQICLRKCADTGFG